MATINQILEKVPEEARRQYEEINVLYSTGLVNFIRNSSKIYSKADYTYIKDYIKTKDGQKYLDLISEATRKIEHYYIETLSKEDLLKSIATAGAEATTKAFLSYCVEFFRIMDEKEKAEEIRQDLLEDGDTFISVLNGTYNPEQQTFFNMHKDGDYSAKTNDALHNETLITRFFLSLYEYEIACNYYKKYGVDKEIIDNIMEQSKRIALKVPSRAFIENAINSFVNTQIAEDLKAWIGESAKRVVVNSIKSPSKSLLPLDKISDTIFSPETYGLTAEQLKETIAVNVNNKNNPVRTSIAVDFDEISSTTGLTLSKKLTPTDRAVYDGIISLYDNGADVITPQIIYRVMNGGQDRFPTKEKVKEVLASVDKMATTFITYDATNEAEKFKYNDDFIKSIKTTILKMTRIKATISGQDVDAIKIEQPPALYQYSKAKKQLASVPINLLASPISKTDWNMCIERYLLRRLVMAKNPHNKMGHKGLTIRYENIFKSLCQIKEKKTLQRTEKQRARNTIKTLLDFYKQEGYIKSYKEIIEKKEIVSVYIALA